MWLIESFKTVKLSNKSKFLHDYQKYNLFCQCWLCEKKAFKLCVLLFSTVTAFISFFFNIFLSDPNFVKLDLGYILIANGIFFNTVLIEQRLVEFHKSILTISPPEGTLELIPGKTEIISKQSNNLYFRSFFKLEFTILNLSQGIC